MIAGTPLDDVKDEGAVPSLVEIADLASALELAKRPDWHSADGGAGAVFLVGAGCSVSAGIASAAGVAEFCAMKLARTLSAGVLNTEDPGVALRWLIDERKVSLPAGRSGRPDRSEWGRLYTYFFESHFQSANQQREIINAVVEKGGNRLNWAHACLGELVRLRYVHTVLTTNFDQLVLQGIIRTGVMPVIADGLEALDRIVGRPRRPQVVHIHGSMHTYDMRNSRVSMDEPGRNNVAQSMVHVLMQECDLLVVVGYSGGEEGIMTLLKDAARVRRRLVVYWVTYGNGLEELSANARDLLRGENKFVVRGGDADRFFGQLMSELSLGQPEWVRDPVGALKAQSALLVAPGPPLTDIRIIVEAYRMRVDHAAQEEHRLDEGHLIKVQAAEARARGAYREAYELLGRVDRDQDAEAARLHALNGLSLCEEEADRALLDAAMHELEGLIPKTAGDEQLENVLALLQALFMASEYGADEIVRQDEDPLRRAQSVAEGALPRFTAAQNRLGNGRLNLMLAQALHGQGERLPNSTLLAQAKAAYEEAVDAFLAAGEGGGLLLEAKAGLAATLQVLGEENGDVGLLREAVERHREVVELSRPERPAEFSGPLRNLAGSLVALAERVQGAERENAYREAKEGYLRLSELQPDGDEAAAEEVRFNLASIDKELAGTG